MGNANVDMKNWNIEEKKQALEKAKKEKYILIVDIENITNKLKEKTKELNQLNLNIPWLENEIQKHEKS